MASLLQSAKLTEEQLQELEEILEQCKETKGFLEKDNDKE